MISEISEAAPVAFRGTAELADRHEPGAARLPPEPCVAGHSRGISLHGSIHMFGSAAADA